MLKIVAQIIRYAIISSMKRGNDAATESKAMRNLIGRKEAEQIAGVSVVKSLDDINAEPTGVIQHNGMVEYKAEVSYMNGDDKIWLTAFYYQDAEVVAECEDLSNLFWEIEGYEIF